MLRKVVLRHNLLHIKGFPVRTQTLLCNAVEDPPIKAEKRPSRPPSLKGRIVRKNIIVRRSAVPSKFEVKTHKYTASLIKSLNHILRSFPVSDVKRAKIDSVLVQLQRFLTVDEAEIVGKPSKEENEDARVFLNRLDRWNQSLAANIDIQAFSGENPKSLYFHVEKLRTITGKKQLFNGEIICSVDGVYNTLLRVLAGRGMSEEMFEVLEWIADDGLKPNFKSYATVLEGIGHPRSNASWNSLAKLVHQMKADGHCLQDLLLVDDYSPKSLSHILKAVSKIELNFWLNPRKVETENERFTHFSVLKRYLESEVSEVNPLHGVASEDKLTAGFEEQLKMEKVGYMEIEPIAELQVNVSPEKQNSLRQKLYKEREMWRASLAIAVEDYRKRMERLPILRTAISVLSVDTVVDIMLNEIDYIVSESVTSYTKSYVSHRRLGECVYFAYKMKIRDKEDHTTKLRAIYNDYMHFIMTSERRNPKLFNLADVWETVAAPHLKSDSLNLKTPEWNNYLCYTIGAQLHSIMYSHLKFNTKALSEMSKRIEAPVIFESLEQHDDRMNKYIKIHPVLLRWFHLSGLPPMRFLASQLPMLCPPLPWVNPERQCVAGFLFSQDYASKLVRNDFADHRLGAPYLTGLSRKEYSPVLDALNVISSVAWRVNRPILDTVSQVYKSCDDRQLLRKLSIPVAPDKLPVPPPLPDPNLPFLQRSAALRAVKEAQLERQQMFSLWYTELYRLSIANKFRNSTFWLPHSMDFRGRVYPSPPHFNYMGSDISRSLLIFAKGRPLGANGLDWLMIHLVNLTGLKKRSSNKQRLAFAHTIVDEIMDSAEQPLNGRGWWMQEDDPWQVLACCMEIANALKNPDHRNYVSYFPVHQDGSCNGLQHYAALGRDCLGADCVNLTPRENPQDVYADVGELVEQQRKEDAANGVMIAQQLDGYVKRKVIKQSVMTTVYGVTFYGAQLQIARQLRDFEEFPPELIQAASTYLARLTLDSIGKIFTSSVKIQDWLVDSARAISGKLYKPVAWKTPLGLPVVQPYVKDDAPNSLLTNEKLPNVAKQARAFPPNFVHSLDAAHMALTALSCYRQGITFAAVHDCYWTHAADVLTLGAACREQFVALHEEPLLQELSNSLIDNFDIESTKKKLPNILGDVPERGDLNIKTVLESEYFFS